MQFREKALRVLCPLLFWLWLGTALASPDFSKANFDLRDQESPIASDVSPTQRQVLARIREKIPDAELSWDRASGTVRWVRSRNGFLTGRKEARQSNAPSGSQRSSRDPRQIIMSFLDEHGSLLGYGSEALHEARVEREFTSAQGGIKTIVWEQHFDGIPVFDGRLVGHVTPQEELISLSSRFVSRSRSSPAVGSAYLARKPAVAAITYQRAVAQAALCVDEPIPISQFKSASPAVSGGYNLFLVEGLAGPASVRLVWFPLSQDQLRLGWEVILTSPRHQEMFQLVVDAETEEVLVRRSLTCHLSDATYRVFTSDSPSPFSPGHAIPLTDQPALGFRSLVTLSALNTNASPNGWINDGDNETRGNNVDAHLDRDANNQPDLPRPQGSPFRVFDFPLDLSQSPLTYGDAAVVQLFYWGNWMHDRLYELGFTEAAGNFQNDNFGRGGVGGDAIQADAQDGSGYKNARFDSPPDGLPGRMTIQLFSGATPFRDADFDTEVILHEYTHGLTARRVGGGNALMQLQPKGLAEGWSDFYALSLLSNPGDDVHGCYAMGAYVGYEPPMFTQNYYYGYRRYPYSTDLTKNPLTFKDVDPAQASGHLGVPRNPNNSNPPNNIYSLGELWCVTLWEMRANLIQKHGFAAGNQLALQLVTEGINLTPPEPSFIEARDAILLADRVMNHSTNFYEVWGAFAKRGLGRSATAPPSPTTAGVKEAFDLPDELSLSPTAGSSSVGAEGGPFTVISWRIELSNLGTNVVAWSATTTNAWLSLSQTGGLLNATTRLTNLVVSLSEASEALPAGVYTGIVHFMNAHSGATQEFTVNLRVGQTECYTELFDSRDLDLAFTTLTFTPDGSASYYALCRTPAVGFPTLPDGGSTLVLSDDDSVRIYVAEGKAVSIYGSNFNALYVGANGYVTFEAGDATSTVSLQNHFDQLRISGLFQDMNPSWGGTVSWKQLSDRIALTYQEVPEFNSMAGNNVQMELFFDGTIRITLLALAAKGGLVGLSRGQGVPPGFYESDLSTYGSCGAQLQLAIPLAAVEGDGVISGTLAVPYAPSADLLVRLASSDASEVVVPDFVTILAGATNAPFQLTIVDDSILDGPHTVSVVASSTGYRKSTALITVEDNESASLVVLLPPSVFEGAGLVQGAVSVSELMADDVQVALSTPDTALIQVPSAVIIRAGEATAVFPITVFDNPLIDGTKPAVVQAHVANWNAGAGTLQILDNERTDVAVGLPARLLQGSGTTTNAGVVWISGIVSSNLVVSLSSISSNRLWIPSDVLVSAGQTSALFSITVQESAHTGSNQVVEVNATAPGFCSGRTTVTLISDDSPPVPANLYPANTSSNIPVRLALAWQMQPLEMSLNGAFETGDLGGWSETSVGNGGFSINDGTYDPVGPGGSQAPLAGAYCVVSDPDGPGNHVLYQDIGVPGMATVATLRWAHRLHNHSGVYTEKQQFRMEIRDLNNQVLAIAFATSPGDPMETPWIQRNYDLTGFRGRGLRLAFVVENQLDYFNVLIDNVSVTVESSPPTWYEVYFGSNLPLIPGALQGTTTNQYWELPPLWPLTSYYWGVIARRHGQSTSPVWHFTTRGVSYFEWNPLASVQEQNQYFAVSLVAKDEYGNVVTNYPGPATLLARPQVPDIQIGNGGEASPFPLAAGSRAARTQATYWASELQGPQKFSALSLQVASIPGQILTNWTIRMKHAQPDDPANLAWQTSDWQTVFEGMGVIADEDWITFEFRAPFDYDGVNNLLIDFSFRNASSSFDGYCAATNTDVARTISARSDQVADDPLAWSDTTPPPAIGYLIPNVRLVAHTPFLSMTPTCAPRFVNGRWTGYATLFQPGTNIVLLALDAEGHQGISSPFSVLPIVDSDSDGLPDAWEARYELNYQDGADAMLDGDGDGASNLHEYYAGTNPQEAGSALRVLSIEREALQMKICFTSASGRYYRLERASDPLGPWTTVSDHIGGTGAVVCLMDDGNGGPGACFYQVKLHP